MRKTVFTAIALAVLLTPLYGQTTGEVLNQKIESQGRASGASAAEISEAQQIMKNSLPMGTLDGGWKVVSPFDNIHVKQMQLPPPGHRVTLVISPELASYIDTSGPRGLGGSIRTYAFFLGRGLTGTMAAYLEKYVGPVTVLNSTDIPRQGLAVVPGLSNFNYKFPAGILSNIQVNLDLDIKVYWNGSQVHSSVYRLVKEKGPKPFVAVNSSPVAENMVYLMSELVSRSIADINTSALASAGEAPVILDIDKIILATLSWEDYQKQKDKLTKEEKGLVHYFMAIDKSYRDYDTDRQAELLSKLQNFVKTRSINPASREQLLDEIREKYAMRETQQRVRNEIDDQIFNFAGEHTETVLTAAEIVPDVVKVGLIVANPIAAASLAATMAAFETAEGIAKFSGAASAEYFFGSGDVNEALFEGSKAFLIDQAGGAAGKAIGKAVAGRLATRQAADMAAYASSKGYSDDFARHVSAEVYKKSSQYLKEPMESTAQLITKPGADLSADMIKQAYENFNLIESRSVTAAANPEASLPTDTIILAGEVK